MIEKKNSENSILSNSEEQMIIVEEWSQRRNTKMRKEKIYKYFWNERYFAMNGRVAADENSIIAERSCEQFQYLPNWFLLHGSENSEKEKCEPESDEKIT